MLITKPADSHLTSSYMHTLTTNDLRPRKTLTVYKASAGSGKTFRLAVEYIKLLLDNPKAYEGILAVTFTNKATDEMKSRILKELHLLATSPKDSPYYEELVGSFETEDALRRRSETVLCDILHDYGAFAVSTIDRFFQQTLKAFSREIGQFATYQVELGRGRGIWH